MNPHILLGAEDVLRASHNMQQAAATINAAVNQLDFTVHQLQVFMTEWLEAANRVVEKVAAAKEVKP